MTKVGNELRLATFANLPRLRGRDNVRKRSANTMAAEATLSQGVARMLEKFVESAYSRQVDEVRLTTTRPAGEGTERIVAADALPAQEKAVVDRLLRQEVSRTAFRQLYRQRVRGFQEKLRALEPRVAEELSRAPQQQVTIGVRGRQDMQITIGRKAPQPPPPGQQQQQQQPRQAEGAGEAAAPLAARTPPLTKGILRQAVADATLKAMTQLGVDAHQPFRAALAAQAAAHPQLRALVVSALPDAIEAARHAAESKRRRISPAGEDPSTAAATTTATTAPALGRKSAPRLPASALLVKIKARQ